MFLTEPNLSYELFGSSRISLGFAFEVLQVCFGVFLPPWSWSYKFAIWHFMTDGVLDCWEWALCDSDLRCHYSANKNTSPCITLGLVCSLNLQEKCILLYPDPLTEEILVLTVTTLPFSGPGNHNKWGQHFPWSSSGYYCPCGIIMGRERPIKKCQEGQNGYFS